MWKITLKNLDIIVKKLNNRPKKINKVVKEEFKTQAKETALNIKNTVPVKSWKLKRSIKIDYSKQSSMQIWIYTELFYAPFIEFWTKPHFIRPKNWKALRWKSWRKSVFSKWHKVSWIKAHKMFFKQMRVLKNKSAKFKKQIRNRLLDELQ